MSNPCKSVLTALQIWDSGTKGMGGWNQQLKKKKNPFHEMEPFKAICQHTIFKNQRVAELFRLERLFWDYRTWYTCSSRSATAGCSEPSAVEFWISEVQRLHNPSGNLLQCLTILTIKKNFLHVFGWDFLCFNFCPLPLVLPSIAVLRTFFLPSLGVLLYFKGELKKT